MKQFTRDQIAQRKRREEAAIIIDNIVYDVSKFIEDHPGGAEVLVQQAGGDASRCFHQVGHSEDAKLWRAEFKIGEIVEEERWEVLGAVPEEDSAPERLTLQGLLDVWTPPLALAAVAVLAYTYLF